MTVTPDQLRNSNGGQWGQHHRHPASDWRDEVTNNTTRLGYWEWVASRLNDDEDVIVTEFGRAVRTFNYDAIRAAIPESVLEDYARSKPVEVVDTWAAPAEEPTFEFKGRRVGTAISGSTLWFVGPDGVDTHNQHTGQKQTFTLHEATRFAEEISRRVHEVVTYRVDGLQD